MIDYDDKPPAPDPTDDPRDPDPEELKHDRQVQDDLRREREG